MGRRINTLVSQPETAGRKSKSESKILNSKKKKEKKEGRKIRKKERVGSFPWIALIDVVDVVHRLVPFNSAAKKT